MQQSCSRAAVMVVYLGLTSGIAEWFQHRNTRPQRDTPDTRRLRLLPVRATTTLAAAMKWVLVMRRGVILLQPVLPSAVLQDATPLNKRNAVKRNYTRIFIPVVRTRRQCLFTRRQYIHTSNICYTHIITQTSNIGTSICLHASIRASVHCDPLREQ